MLTGRMKKIIYICVFLFVVVFMIDTNMVNAAYVGCEKQIEDTDFYDCGNFVYT